MRLRTTILLLLTQLLALGCGAATRLVIGPTVDSAGHVGVEVAISQGLVFPSAEGPRQHAVQTAASLRAGASGGSAVLGAAVGADWLLVSPAELLWLGADGAYSATGGEGALLAELSVGRAWRVGAVRAASLLVGPEFRCGHRFGLGQSPTQVGTTGCLAGVSLHLLNVKAWSPTAGPVY